MIKALFSESPLARFVACTTASPFSSEFAPKVEARCYGDAGKSDRLEIQGAGRDCSDDRIWPNPCLRAVGYEILKDQIVTARRARQREGRRWPSGPSSPKAPDGERHIRPIGVY